MSRGGGRERGGGSIKDWRKEEKARERERERERESGSLVPRPRAPPGEKRSGERSQIPWAYYPKRVMTNEIARSVIITLHFA